MVDDHRLRRLRASRATGRVPPDLVPWLIEIAAAMGSAEMDTAPRPPVEHIAIQVSEEIDRWMTRRRLTGRTIGVSRRTLARCLKAQNVTLASVADVADALGCRVVLRFSPTVGVTGTTLDTDGTKPLPGGQPKEQDRGQP